MRDDKDFPMDADLGSDDIEIEFVDEDSGVTSVVEQPKEFPIYSVTSNPSRDPTA